MDRRKAEEAVRALVEALDLGETGELVDPKRVVGFYEEALSDTNCDPASHVTRVGGVTDGETVAVRDISFSSICEHDLLPFFGRVHVAYVPRGGRGAGFTGIVRLVRCAARRPQLQERLASDIADAMVRALDPEGVYVVVEATQLCVVCRDDGDPDARTLATATRGCFEDPNVRVALSGLGFGSTKRDD
jgi:GTP cyclohydrolase I